MTIQETQVPAHLPTSNRPLNAGQSVDDQASRLDGVAKVTGRARYSRDMYLDGMLFVQLVRCPWGMATLESADIDAAKAVPGVVQVEITGKRGDYHGDVVGRIVATSKIALRRGRRALKPQWRREEPRASIDHAVKPLPAPNEDAEISLASSDFVLEATYSTPVQTHSALETHGLAVDHQGESAIVYASTQGTFVVAGEVPQFLKLPQSRTEVRCEYVGGGFGAKFQIGKEGAAAASVAAITKKPTSCFCDRDEEHLDTGNRPSMRADVKIGFARDGTVLGGIVKTWGGTGIGQGGGASFPSGRYVFGSVQKEHADVQFNAGAPRAMRAPGSPQGAFAEELMLDEIATRCGVDPLELRTRLDSDRSGERREMFTIGAELIGWDQRAATGSQKGVLRRGFGMGSATWGAGAGRASAEVVIRRDGSVEARTGTQDIGTGQRTIMGIVTAEQLGVPLSIVSVSIGRSTLPEGPASGGSVTAPSTAPAMMQAAIEAKRLFLEALAEHENIGADELDIRAGEVLRLGEPMMSFADACALLPSDSLVGKATFQRGGLHWGEGHSHGAQFAEVEVDVETGVVHVRKVVAIQSCGRVISRKTAESQIIGGVIQGLSYALFENRILDRVTGAMVNPNLEMYKIAGAADMPHIVPVLWNNGQTGVRALGEPPVIPTAGAIACAVYNAVGAPVRHLPLTPDKVLAAVAAGAGDRS